MAASSAQLQFARYHLTAAPEKSAVALGFQARDTSVAAIRRFRGTTGVRDGGPPCDPFGLDRTYIEASERGFMGFLRRRYWRVEMQGLEHVPAQGGAVLVGLHRGFMPFDGVMTVLGILRGTGRILRFLIHPGVGLRFPFLFTFMSKFGGVVACRENAERVLESGQLLGIYPEGIRGAFTPYRRAYRVGPSWRNDCVAIALRHRVPIVPFVTLGSAEIFPILGRIRSRRWKAYAEWPFVPITPTFPLLPVPLPSKWHTLFLEPMRVGDEYPPEAADDPAVVRAIGAELKDRIEHALDDLRRRRRSIFFGSIFRSGRS
jgi:1-acyl-sn-glycerol-3-phosphate acyltransferase